jgi:glycosyltransferase involved in cell wall biosynthesis
MMERGYDVKVITTTDWNFKRYDALFFPLAKVLRYPVIFQIKKAKIYFRPDILSELCQTYDVVHSFTFFTFSSVLAAPAMSRVKVIRAEIGAPKGLNFVKARYGIYSILTNMYKGSYDYITVYNRLEAKSLELLGFPRERIIILPPMIDLKRFSSLYSIHGKNSSMSIGVISRISPEKGIHRVVSIIKEILKNMPDASRRLKLILAGRIDNEEYARRVLTDLRNLLQSRFIYLGEIAPPYRFYKSVDVVVVPSLTETGAIVVLEAMAAGKCVVASNIYPINLYITHKLNGFLFNTPSEAAKIILDILEGCVDIKSVSKEAQKYAKEHDYRIICRTLERVYYHGSRQFGVE